MTFWNKVRRELSGTLRSVGYDARRRLRTWRGRADDAYPEYAAYVRRPRRALYGGGIAGLAVLGVAGTYLALAGGLGGWLLGEDISAPNPGSSGATTVTNAGHAGRPAAKPNPSPAPPPATDPPPTAGSHGTHGSGGRTPIGAASTPPTHRATSTPTQPGSSTPGTPRPSPSPSSDPPVTPTDPPTSTVPSPPDSPTPSPSESAAIESTTLAAAAGRAERAERPSSTISTAGA
jgi:hypothetical protein